MIKGPLIFFVKTYQTVFSPLLGRHCRFYPSCSEYGVQALKKYGAVVGCKKTLKRILKCNPWNPGGVDLP